MDEWQEECRSLARSGISKADNVCSLENMRDDLILNCSRCRVFRGCKIAQNGCRKAEVGEGVCRLVRRFGDLRCRIAVDVVRDVECAYLSILSIVVMRPSVRGVPIEVRARR